MFHLNNTPTGLKQYEGDLKKKYTFLGELLLYVLYRIFTDLVCLTVFVCIYSHAVFRHDAPRKHPNLGGYERTPPPQEKQTLPGLSFLSIRADAPQYQKTLRRSKWPYASPRFTFQMQTKPQAHKCVRLSTYSLQA